VSGIGHVELLEVAGTPAGHVEHSVVDRQVDVRDQRWHGPERAHAGGRSSAAAGSAAMVITLSAAHSAVCASRCQRHTDADRSVVDTTTPT
jgi:hypothetical protein